MDAIFLDGASIAKPWRETWAELRHTVAGSMVSFRQGCEACLCKIEAVAEGRLCGDVISKQGVHVVADAIAQIVADSAHTFQPVD